MQKLVYDSVIFCFSLTVNRYLDDGWRIVPKTLKYLGGLYIVVLEKN